MNLEKFRLSTADYAIFSAMLFVSAGIGIFFQIRNKKKTSKEYLFAGKDMSILPVAFSLMATYVSATTLMGIPAEMYLYGTNMALMNIGFFIGPIITSYVFLPIYFANDVSTVYEYLEKRFGKTTRKISSALFAVQTILVTSVTLYAPALALSAVTSLSLSMSVFSVGVVCIFYSTLGGMKAVLWADVLQSALMYVCVFAVIVQGCLLLDGIGNVFEIADEGGRIVFPKFSFNLDERYTFVNIFAQGMIITMSIYGGSQVLVQRLLTLRNIKRSRTATYISIAMVMSYHLLCCLCGLVIYAYFRSCDPLTSSNSPIHSADQLLPYFISTTLGHLPGIPGLCICGIFSASLSTVSSSINSLASIAVDDFIQPHFPNFKVNVFHIKLMSLFFGIICISLSFIVESLGNLTKITVILYGNLCGPNIAVFLLAACTTTTNEGGVILGIVTSIALAAYLSFNPNKKTESFLPLSNSCTSFETAENNTSFPTSFSHLQNHSIYHYSNTSSAPMYGLTSDEVNTFHISFMWVSFLCLCTCLLVGYFGSMAISFFSRKSEEKSIRNWFSERKVQNKGFKRQVKNEETEFQEMLPENTSSPLVRPTEVAL